MCNMIPFRGHRQEAGFTLIELIIAGAVLVIGVLALSGLVALAVAGNGRSRLDSTSTMLAQAVVEQVNAGLSYGVGGPAEITDCGTHGASNPWPIDSGIPATPTPLINGNIDFTQPTVAGYHMDYVICNGTTQVTYDVRWSISALAPTGTTSFTNMLTVGSRLKGGVNSLTFPVNIHVMVGPDP